MTMPVELVPMVQSTETAKTGPPSGYLARMVASSTCAARTTREARRVVLAGARGATRAPVAKLAAEEARTKAAIFAGGSS